MLFWALTLAPASRSIATMCRCPFCAAMWIGQLPVALSCAAPHAAGEAGLRKERVKS